MVISPSCSRSGLISRERETRPETCIGLSDQESRNSHRKIKEAVHIQLEDAKLNRTEGRRRGVGPNRPMQVSGLVSRSREIRPLCEQDGLIAIENLERNTRLRSRVLDMLQSQVWVVDSSCVYEEVA
ncbi:hypothetical protein Bbelb_433370 [Branchiostoma belcheri]|nr:hypothetical protein Bbelb_433370 [Branchiostoma belcheri]